MSPREQLAQDIWHRHAPDHVATWEEETHKAEWLHLVDGISTGLLSNLLLSRINFDGMYARTFSLAELQRAIDGAEWPGAITAGQRSGT